MSDTTPIHGDLPGALARRKTPFALTPRHWRGRAYGMQYIRLDEPAANGDGDAGGRLWITRLGWPRLGYLLPDRWFTDGLYAQTGQRLTNATATVYRVPTTPAAADPAEASNDAVPASTRPPLDLVIKFARFAQDVPIWVTTGYADKDRILEMGDPRFNSPFEEFGRVSALRRKRYEDGGIPIHTGRPLAIYSPGGERPLWQLGRTKSRFRPYTADLKKNQPGAMLEDDPTFFELGLKREYVLIYEWLKGIDCEEAFERGLVSQREMEALTRRVTEELTANGFLVLDNKPRHFVLRQRGGGLHDGELIRRNGKLVYGLIDFELLQPIRSQ